LILVGVILGFGLLNKYSMSVFAFALCLGLRLTKSAVILRAEGDNARPGPEKSHAQFYDPSWRLVPGTIRLPEEEILPVKRKRFSVEHKQLGQIHFGGVLKSIDLSPTRVDDNGSKSVRIEYPPITVL